MTNRTAWTGGLLNTGLAWTAFFNAADLNSMANGSSVLSGVSAITNGTSLDQFFDVSFQLTIASNTIAAGANLAMWLFPLMEDGTTFGDASLTAGTQAAITPGLYPKLVMPLRAGATQTLLFGVNNDPLVMPPGSWLPVLQNNSGFALAASGNAGKFRSYNLQLNN
jgi:hypothetical protein